MKGLNEGRNLRGHKEMLPASFTLWFSVGFEGQERLKQDTKSFDSHVHFCIVLGRPEAMLDNTYPNITSSSGGTLRLSLYTIANISINIEACSGLVRPS